MMLKPPMAQMRPGVVIEAEIVGAAMANRLGHALQDRRLRRLGGRHGHKSGNPAHDKECGIGAAALNLDKIEIGGMGEWLKPAVLKTVSGVTRSGVRIPLPPPLYRADYA